MSRRLLIGPSSPGAFGKMTIDTANNHRAAPAETGLNSAVHPATVSSRVRTCRRAHGIAEIRSVPPAKRMPGLGLFMRTSAGRSERPGGVPARGRAAIEPPAGGGLMDRDPRANPNR